MPVLENVRHERMVNSIAKGLSPVEAYKSAGFLGKAAATNASEILNRPEVKARLKELTSRISKSAVAQASAKLALTKELILAELWDNAQQGRKVKGGSSVRNRALELLGKHLGMFQEASDKPVKLEDLSTEDLKKLLEVDPKPVVQ